jgi:hypothetical protein
VIAAALGTALLWWLIACVRHRVAPERVRVARRWTLICAVGMLACVPWLAYTYSVTRHLFYWGNSGGISLYWMSAPGAPALGAWHAPHTVLTDPALAAYRPFFSYLNSLPPLQRDLELQHVALVQALAHPAKYALNLLANLGRMFLGFPFSFTLPTAVIVALILVNGTLLACLLAAARSLIRTRAPLPRETVPFLLFGALAFAVHLLPTAEPRMVVPIIPIPIWLIGQAWGRRTRTRIGGGAARLRVRNLIE